MLGADADGRDVSENISNQSPLESRCLVEFVLCLFRLRIGRDVEYVILEQHVFSSI